MKKQLWPRATKTHNWSGPPERHHPHTHNLEPVLSVLLLLVLYHLPFVSFTSSNTLGTQTQGVPDAGKLHSQCVRVNSMKVVELTYFYITTSVLAFEILPIMKRKKIQAAAAVVTEVENDKKIRLLEK